MQTQTLYPLLPAALAAITMPLMHTVVQPATLPPSPGSFFQPREYALAVLQLLEAAQKLPQLLGFDGLPYGRPCRRREAVAAPQIITKGFDN